MNGKQFVWCWMVLLCSTSVLFNGASASGKQFGGLNPPAWTSYEIVTPVRLDQGSAHKGQHHFQKRSVEMSENQGARNNGHAAQYLVEAFGEGFVLDLEHDASFLAPSFNLHVSRNEDVDSHDVDNSVHCFYAGHVNGHTESNAVVSLCGGMFGLFHTHNGTQFYIEPQGGVEEGMETNTKPHVVYSSGTPPPDPSTHTPTTSGCGVTDDTHPDTQTSPKLPTNSISSQIYGLVQSITNSLKAKESDTTISEDDETNTPHHRGKRFISYERFLEMMVVADHKMVEHHGSGVSHYVLTLVAVVNRIFRDPSIGNAINVTLVELKVLTNPEDGPAITSNAPETLRDFCMWQEEQNHADDTHPHHYDTAVLITREDICRSGPDCDTLGLAELGTVCDSMRSCSIVEDNGLSAAFTMAHELGHVFNMLHDSNFKCQTYEEMREGKYAVMAPTLNYFTTPWKWSKCSRRQLTEFLDLGSGECLLDRPTEMRALPSFQPGEVYNISKQCELVFGHGSTLCTYMRTCKRLWCTGSSQGSQTGCRTQHMPWADGTPCGSHHWCFLGECRERDYYVEVVDGQWGKWEEYSTCSRTCGGGVKEAMRQCNNPAPQNGGKYCIGRRLRFKSCNMQPCPEGVLDFREKQCAEFNGRQYINGIQPGTRWVPKYTGVQLQDRCKLYCRVAGSSAYYELKRKVVDGTKCGPDTDDICVHGQCRQAGCDHMLSSNTKRDDCGICGGNNSTCRRVRGFYNNASHGYTKIVTIPSGATKVDIKQHSYSGTADDDNFLALFNDKDQFILNGNFMVKAYSIKIHINNSVIEYSGSDTAIESIRCEDKLQRAISLYILSVGDLYPPNVTYSYNVPLESYPVYVWDRSGPWSECDRDCDGLKQREVRCVDANANRQVNDAMCSGHRPEPIKEECNTRCVGSWYILAESECSSPCGPGYISRTISCMKTPKKRRGTHTRVPDEYCDGSQRPADNIACQGPCINYRWEYSAWSHCSSSCNGGTRSRGASCRDGRGYLINDVLCDPSILHTVEPCNSQSCPIWSSSEWSSCSVTCGLGEEHRVVSCYQEGQQVDNSQCTLFSKPDTTRRCELSNCPYWATGHWSSCSVSCGTGSKRRAVRCRQYDGQSLNESECSAGSKPIDTMVCEPAECPTTTTQPPPTTTPRSTTAAMPTAPPIVVAEVDPAPGDDRRDPDVSPASKDWTFRSQWRTGAWTLCSTTCGPGIRERYVSCRNIGGDIDKGHCNESERPASREVCEVKSCPHWRTGDWRECPVTCGEGVTTRYVACLYSDDTIVSNRECDPNFRPSGEHPCFVQDCPSDTPQVPQGPRGRNRQDQQDNRQDNRVSTGYWRTGRWSPCSVSCGEGTRQRRVECQDQGSISTSCDAGSRPHDWERCDAAPCPSWDYGEWGHCTASCGGGTRSRVVKCRRRTGETIGDHWCVLSEKPDVTVGCNTDRCPRDTAWHKSAYSPCSVSCGRGVKTRIVVCRYGDDSLAPDSECTVRKPPRERRCKTRPCTQWKSGDWQECTVTCGRGVQEREVACISENRQVNESLCLEEKPRTSKGCRRPSCPRYLWKKGRWSECANTCGSGVVKVREVWCQDNSGQKVDDDHCRATRKRPSMKRKCELDPCPLNFSPAAFWVEGLWEECSRTCGAGEQLRQISCQSLSEHGWRIPADIAACNPETRPEESRRCNMGPCFGDFHWTAGPWNQCSKSCGDGVQRRKVQCQARHGKVMPDRFCRHPAIKPETERICNSRPCPPTSCRDLQHTENIQEDGDYSMLIQGRLLKIFCHGMAGDNPAEYLTLPASEAENYSEIYPKRLLNPTYCPNNGARNDNCECTNYGHRSPGLTSFNKIRLNVTTLEVITDDPAYATVHHGHFIPYATAGDCYSSVACPQGRFHLSLNGTGLVVAPDVDWATEGHSVSRRISRDAINQRVSGICGGYCGKCFPDRGAGRLLPLTFQS